VFRAFIAEQLERRLGGEFQHNVKYHDDVLWVLGELRRDPGAGSLDFERLEAAFRNMFRSPFEAERALGRLAAMFLVRWRCHRILAFLEECRGWSDLSGQDCREILMLLGAGAMWSKETASRLKDSMDEWTLRLADDFHQLFPESSDGDPAAPGRPWTYSFSQPGFLRARLGAPVHDIYILLAQDYSHDPALLRVVLSDLAAVAVSDPQAVVQTVVEIATCVDFSSPELRRAVAEVVAIVGVEQGHLVEGAVDAVAAEDYAQVAHDPRILARHAHNSINQGTMRATWGMVAGQSPIWPVLVEFLDELARSSSLQEYLEEYAIARLWSVVNAL
jgi:hypothetical protein